jgi:ABC-type phosphate transport system substrate-binding protein
MKTSLALRQGIGLAISESGTAVGLKCAIEKTCQIGMVNEVTLEDQQKLKAIFFGSNAKGIIVCKDVSITNLTTSQVKGIFTGQIKNWKEVGGQALHSTSFSKWSHSIMSSPLPKMDIDF